MNKSTNCNNKPIKRASTTVITVSENKNGMVVYEGVPVMVV